MKILDLAQDSPDWLAWRDKGIGASESAAVMGLDPWTSRNLLLRRKTGQAEPAYFNQNMRRGKLLEPEARERYEALYGWPMPAVCVVHDDFPWLKASLDGLRADHQLILEIKAPGEKTHRKMLREGIPDHYFCQVQHQLLIVGAPLAHFVYLCKEVPSRQFNVIEVPADKEFQEMLLEELEGFWNEVTATIDDIS